ncbi:hypothetical protein Hthe01_18940 [Hydrogenophilus thermoluteolus]|uniref:hypothetical protein n=1 Tax=Hydrogenophilus thermoluteolus TaxID=297 RepID=UPI0024A33781|nr:hypothetical protein [Hydrogenophilus thermoluteolus]GLW61545.1 hypothetical protein Hthe01_18940 [Hydrogenophilus thermoluteolus]
MYYYIAALIGSACMAIYSVWRATNAVRLYREGRLSQALKKVSGAFFFFGLASVFPIQLIEGEPMWQAGFLSIAGPFFVGYVYRKDDLGKLLYGLSLFFTFAFIANGVAGVIKAFILFTLPFVIIALFFIPGASGSSYKRSKSDDDDDNSFDASKDPIVDGVSFW